MVLSRALSVGGRRNSLTDSTSRDEEEKEDCDRPLTPQ